jgi:uncharacterized delta-60 repeat protein
MVGEFLSPGIFKERTMRNVICHTVLAAVASASANPALAATNGLDAKFGTGGIFLFAPTPVSGIVFEPRTGLAIQSDGKIVLGGRTTNMSDPGAGAILPAIARLNTDGSWDTDFADHGIFVLPYATAAAPNGGEIHEVALLSDHSIVAVGGAYAGFGGGDFSTCTLMIRLTDAGTLSPTFAPDQSGSFCFDFAPNTDSSTWFFHYEGLLVDAGDSIYLTTPYTNLAHGAVAQFNANGGLMSGYGSQGIAALPDGVVATMLQPAADNGLLAIGGTNSEIHVIRLDSTGAMDESYGTGGSFVFDTRPEGGVVSPIQCALDVQKRLVIADNDAAILENLPYRFARLTFDGALDSTFNGASQQPGFPGFAIPVVSATSDDMLWSVLPLADGHLFALGESGFVAGGNGATNIALLRLNSDSSYDPSFGDTAHTGWSSLNVYGTVTSNNHARMLVPDASGHALATIFVSDGDTHVCAGLIRVIPDRLLEGSFESMPAMPTCPQAQ